MENKKLWPDVKGHQNSNAYRSVIKVVGRVTVYATNTRHYQGVYLTNPSESEIEREITRGNNGNGMNAIYIIHNP